MRILILFAFIVGLGNEIAFARYRLQPEDRLCQMREAQEKAERYGNLKEAERLEIEIEYFKEQFHLQWYNEAYCNSRGSYWRHKDDYRDGFQDGYHYGTQQYYQNPYFHHSPGYKPNHRPNRPGHSKPPHQPNDNYPPYRPQPR
ncbi:hypothetical protein CCZ01_06385 [Helicobacter monodelphidis]|uniref:hypothetical protein n=1 Tax=Helicobacter sp. 15-1451 TaxID=2004995 RepID=UPI000DCD60FB|nr:hypothetical protein [Helicobacter sp. 15-1451]RAX57323.1 hypothetical protein CCZ01_06385 [Helicobacter sp. 15-1451]